MKALAAARHALYRFFGLVFLYPDPGRRARLRRLARALGAEKAVRGLAFFPVWRASWERLQQNLGEGLEEVYLRIFDLTGRRGGCSLCESGYRDASWQAAAELQREYREAGVQPKGPEPSDHLSVELEYLAVLVAREAREWEAGTAGVEEILRRQRDFLRAHPCAWVPELVVRVREHDPTGVYAAAAEALEAFLEHEGDLTELLLRQVGKVELAR
ncbi:MAG: molecular chaperone TorD family protein [Armatimonadota bacterium]|nr:molecular chaperone TorD family protein [Armatimonadota bacterium]MDR7444983.1 molecular chaperone TorD family protein [Armatimonadota bacterium]MDR7570568.1 molecular chaperone TorD family protein [Armatimonadota bacterium]MDR7615082.1 molecular chaperone TorD family protein [Armatimonadota bacterium]